VDSDINMIPMVDLLMTTIAFLLVTAVWSELGRMPSSANVPSPIGEPTPPAPPEPRLHVDMRTPDRFVLSWREGHDVIRSVDLPRELPALRATVAKEWRSNGRHLSPGDPGHDEAVLHVGDGSSYADMVAVMDAVEATRRPLARGDTPALALTLATE
jgi:biopolymer transport protein ExbD